MKKIQKSEIPSFFTLLKIAFSPLSKRKKFLDDYCKKLEKAKDILLKNDPKTEKGMQNRSERMQALTQAIGLIKDISQYATTSLSAMIGAFKDRNRQCKAICVKALNSGSRKKNESATIANEGADIFADVEII